MQSLYELLKASKGLPVSDSYAALWGKSAAESGIKTLTGRLPLFFKTSETKLRDWVIYGNNNVGKNIFEIIPRDQIIKETGTLTFVTDAESGTITANGTAESAESSVKQTFIVTPELSGDYYFSGSFSQTGSLSSFDAYMYDKTAHGFIKKWDGTTTSPTIKGTESQEVKLIEGHNIELSFRVFKNTNVNNVVFKPMLRKAGTSAAFEPYQIGVGEKTENGYVLNIIVGFAPIPEQQPVTHIYSSKKINIGESPLTEGQTLSMSEFGNISIFPYNDVFIAAVKALDLEAPLSYNQPTMMIKFKE